VAHAPTGRRADGWGDVDRGSDVRNDRARLGPRTRRLVAYTLSITGGVAISVLRAPGFVALYHACPGYPDGQCHCFHPYAAVDGRLFPCSVDTCPNPHYSSNARALLDVDRANSSSNFRADPAAKPSANRRADA
jgi:hypothetical protein